MTDQIVIGGTNIIVCENLFIQMNLEYKKLWSDQNNSDYWTFLLKIMGELLKYYEWELCYIFNNKQ